MDQLYAAIASILLISILCYIKSLLTKTRPLPPGPRGLPILGYLPFLRNNLVHHFTDLSRKYGPIFKLYLGSKLCVVISSPSLVKEIVRNQDSVFAHRDVSLAAFIFTYGGNDIAWSTPDSTWRVMRKIFVQEMMSNTSLEASYLLRRDEVRKAVTQVHSDLGKPVEIAELSFRTEFNVIMNMLWGSETIDGEEGEKLAAEFRDVIAKINDLLVKPNVSDFYPVLAGLDIQGIKKEMESYVRSMDRIFDAVIDEHKMKLSRGIKKEGKQDFLQILLEFQQRQDSEMPISLTQIKAIMMDVIVGGIDSTATTVEWAMAELMNNPAAMIKAQKELSDVVGLDNTIEELHMPKLKYLEAVVKETLRLHPAVPLLLPRSPSGSSTVGGYAIPANTRVFLNVWSIQRDASIWDSPTEFRPERFVDDENKKWDFKGNNFEYLPFGSGRRVCAGLPLAERMLIYLLASLLHSFDWKLAEEERLDMCETFGIVLRKTTPLLCVPNPRLSDANLYLL